VAKGYTQIHWVNYWETYAAMVRIETLRFLLAFSVQRGWLIHQIDVDTAFLIPPLTDVTIFVSQHEGYVEPGKICLLRKCLYGLKQSPREWMLYLSNILNEFNFIQCEQDICLVPFNN